MKQVKRLKHYSSDHRILLVGEGDFSFSLCLALAFGHASNIVATSLDSYDVVIKKYKGANTNLEMLHALGGELLHEVDAFQMKLHTNLYMRKFDRIIYNFPHAGFLGLENDPQVIKIHRNLVCGFFKNASDMLCPKGEVHISHKTTEPFNSWNIEELATQNSLTLLECIKFRLKDYPGYNNKRGDGNRADDPFPLGECSTYKFVLFSKGNSSKNDQLCNCDPPLEKVEYISLTKKDPNTRFKDGLTVRVSGGGSVITCKNEPVALLIAKKKRRPRKVQEGQTIGGQSGPTGQNVGGQGGIASIASGSGNGKNEFVSNHASKGGPKSIPKWRVTGVTKSRETFMGGRDSGLVPPGVPMPSASEMANKTDATKHNLGVDSQSQIGAAKPSQQVTPKKKQPPLPHERLLKKKGATKTSATKPKKRSPAAAKPSQQVTPEKKQQTGQLQLPHRRFLKIKPTLLKKKGATSAAAKPSQQVTPKKKPQTEQPPPPHRRRRPMLLKIKPTSLKKKGATSAGGSKATAAKPSQQPHGKIKPTATSQPERPRFLKNKGATPKKRTPTDAKPTQQPPPNRSLKTKPTAAIQLERSPPGKLKKKEATSASETKETAAKASQQVAPNKKEQTSQQQPSHRSFLNVKPTAAVQPEKRRPRLRKKKRRPRKVQEGDMETEGGQTIGAQTGQTVGGQGGIASGSGNGKNEFVSDHASKGGPKSIPKWRVTGVTESRETFLGGRDSVPGVPMPSTSDMAKKTVATKHNLGVDSQSQIGDAQPSQPTTQFKLKYICYPFLNWLGWVVVVVILCFILSKYEPASPNEI